MSATTNNFSSNEFKNKILRNSEEQGALNKANALGLKYVDLRTVIPTDNALKLMKKEDATKYRCIPIAFRNGNLYLGIADPDYPGLQEFLDKLGEKNEIVPVLITDSGLKENLPIYDTFEVEEEKEVEDGTIVLDMDKIKNLRELQDVLQKDGVQNLLSDVLSASLKTKASDIHIEPYLNDASIRVRIDGVLHEIARLPKDRYNYLVSEIILNSGLQLDLNKPQNGRLKTQSLPGQTGNIDIRVETIPLLHGQEVVMRLFQKEASLLKLSQLGITKDTYPIIKDILYRPHGMVIVVGPTGSGKSSTLYAILNELNSPERKVVTLEDPVEYELPGISQSQIGKDETFLERLRAVMREDPDVIMIGEVRDADTAKTALQSALTGHLLLTTFHANNASIAITRLTDMIGDTSLISSAASLIIGQRLVRKVCPYCRVEARLTVDEMGIVKQIISSLPEKYQSYVKELRFYEGKGCDKCMNVGYKGRIGIYEMLKITAEIQQLIIQRALPSAIQTAAIKGGMLTMEQDGILKALMGLTTAHEVLTTIKE